MLNADIKHETNSSKNSKITPFFLQRCIFLLPLEGPIATVAAPTPLAGFAV